MWCIKSLITLSHVEGHTVRNIHVTRNVGWCGNFAHTPSDTLAKIKKMVR